MKNIPIFAINSKCKKKGITDRFSALALFFNIWTMVGYREQELACERVFRNLGEVYHVYTGEKFEVIFGEDDDFKVGMAILGICAKLFPQVKILTFQLMSNHIHILASGPEADLRRLFAAFKAMLSRNLSSKDRVVNWDEFEARFRAVETLNDIRNVVIYINKNGYIVRSEHTPFTYPWGANRYYFNPDAKTLARYHSQNMTAKERRDISRSHKSDNIEGLRALDGYALPLSFCDVPLGESLFRSPSHYFEKLSKNVQESRDVAAQIGETIRYTDTQLFGVLAKICRQQYGANQPSLAPADAKLKLAVTLRYDYNAREAQICRLLDLDEAVLRTILR